MAQRVLAKDEATGPIPVSCSKRDSHIGSVNRFQRFGRGSIPLSRSMKKEISEEHLLIKCDCGYFPEFMELGWFNDEPKIFYLGYTYRPKTVKEKLKAIWKIIKGSNYGISDEVLINDKQAKKLINWLKERL